MGLDALRLSTALAAVESASWRQHDAYSYLAGESFDTRTALAKKDKAEYWKTRQIPFAFFHVSIIQLSDSRSRYDSLRVLHKEVLL